MSNRKPGSAVSPKNTLRISAKQGEAEEAAIARTVLRPEVRAAAIVQGYSTQLGETDLTALVAELSAQNRAVSDGDWRRTEAMLMAQAHTLEALFHELVRRAGLNLGEYINAAEIYMRLGLKAQSQCRATLETLAAIKNPAPVTFVKQSNVAHGPQQVNNGSTPTSEPSRARESENPPSKLLEHSHAKRLDFGAQGATVGANSAVEAVGEVHRAEYPSG